MPWLIISSKCEVAIYFIFSFFNVEFPSFSSPHINLCPIAWNTFLLFVESKVDTYVDILSSLFPLTFLCSSEFNFIAFSVPLSITVFWICLLQPCLPLFIHSCFQVVLSVTILLMRRAKEKSMFILMCFGWQDKNYKYILLSVSL